MDVKELRKHDQSVWLDYIRRHLLASGEFARLVEEDGVSGVTSNPSIFEKAIGGSTDYDEALQRYERTKDQRAAALFERLAIEDIQQAAGVLRPVYDATEARDGFACIEVSPYLAHDTEGTLVEARRLWRELRRENVMVKVPGTREGVPAIRQLTSEGINVNVTLLFGREACRQVAEAYMAGLESLAARGKPLDRMASVASMFVSRIDVMVNPMLEAPGAPDQALRRGLVGKVAIANARLAYQDWKQMCQSPRWRALAERGARVQKLLWASTSTKDPRFSDVMYVEALIGPETIDTIAPPTLDAFREHGEVRDRIEEDLEGARRVMAQLAQAGISIDDVTDRLVEEGVEAFSASFDKLMAAIEKKRAGVLQSALDRTSCRLPKPLDDAVKATLDEWRSAGKVRRLWARDSSLWTGRDECQWLDWLKAADQGISAIGPLLAYAEETRRRGTRQAVVLGMGGSSLCPDVLSRTLGPKQGYPELLVLDSTDPEQIRALEGRIAIDKTLFIVSSKSGTTLEPNLLCDYFYDRVRRAVGPNAAGRRFVAVTDPASPLERAAAERGFDQVFFGRRGIGGRYSALSNFGMVPAAVMGVDLAGFLDRTELMVHACDSCVPPHQNPGVLLGVVLGAAAKDGRDKVTLAASPAISEIGAWLEQLLAESTGKNGKGLIPVDREPLGKPDVYGEDRLFVYLRLDGAPDAAQDAAIAALEQAGQPVVRVALAEPSDIGQEFFRWEIATAVAGSVLGLNPFDQPDVEASKVETRKLTEGYEKRAALPQEQPFQREGALALFADAANRSALERAAGSDRTLAGYLRAHLGRLASGGYFALLAYLARNEANEGPLQDMRRRVRDARRVATCVGFGPRFLHSTGQAYKGGANSGVFLQLTCDDAHDLDVPGHRLSFGVVKAAQARGDFDVLAKRGRRALRVHLGKDVGAGLEALQRAVERALA